MQPVPQGGAVNISVVNNNNNTNSNGRAGGKRHVGNAEYGYEGGSTE